MTCSETFPTDLDHRENCEEFWKFLLLAVLPVSSCSKSLGQTTSKILCLTDDVHYRNGRKPIL